MMEVGFAYGKEIKAKFIKFLVVKMVASIKAKSRLFHRFVNTPIVKRKKAIPFSQ